MSTARRVARNTGVQFVGEAVSKVASVGFYVVMARLLGTAEFGEFSFALSLVVLTTVFAGFGLDAILTTETAREHRRLGELFWNAIAIKAAFGVVGIAIALLVALLGGYRIEVDLAVAVLGVAAVVELITKTVSATFQAHEDMRPVATSLAIQRIATAVIGITAMALGGQLLVVAAAYLAGALIALAYAARALLRARLHPPVWFSTEGARGMIGRSLPIGIATILGAILFRVDATMLSLIKGNDAVGIYSSAYRLLESTLFISYAFVAAAVPTLSRLTRYSVPPVSEAFALATKAICAALLPIGVGFVFYAEPVIELLYGSEYAEAVSVMRLLGGAAALYGLTYLSSYVLVAQGRAKIIPWVTGVVMAENILLNLILIPRHAYDGAAAATSVSEATFAALMLGFAVAAAGRFGVGRAVAGPAAGCGAIGLVVWVGGATWITLPIAILAYIGTLAAVEARFHPADLHRVRNLVRREPAESPG